MRTVGVIGGLGPETTAKFYKEIFFGCQKKNPLVKPHILIASVPLPFEIEHTALLKNEGVERFLPYLLVEAHRLEKAGADFIVIPCNSLHIFIQEIRASVHIPVLSIIEETVDFLVAKNIKKTGVIATSMTAHNRLYEKELYKRGLECVTPNEVQQTELNHIVFRLVNGKKQEKDRQVLLEITRTLKGAECILLACTDLQLLHLELPDMDMYDTMRILANATQREILKNGNAKNI